MDNDTTLPTWDEIFTNLNEEISRYDAMNARFAAMNERLARKERVMRNAMARSSERHLKTYR
jgi:hypothetical protein